MGYVSAGRGGGKEAKRSVNEAAPARERGVNGLARRARGTSNADISRFSATVADNRNATEGVPYSAAANSCRERPPWRSETSRSSNFGGEPISLCSHRRGDCLL